MTAEQAANQERALDCAAEMRVKASEYRQLGFRILAAEIHRQANAAEQWAAKMCKAQP